MNMETEKAIALLNNLRAFAEEDDEPAIDMAIEMMSKMKTGHVETVNDGNPLKPIAWAVCSECKKPIDPWDKYCRSCGAMMLKVQEKSFGEEWE